MVLLGQGTFGMVLSNPRLPIFDESYDDIINLNQVSKILYDIVEKENMKIYIPGSLEDFELEYKDIILLSEEFKNIFNSNYFMLPLKGGILEKDKFINKYNCNDNDNNYNYKWLSESNSTIKIFNSLLNSPNDIYQIIYEKGDKIPKEINTFINGMKNIFEIIIISNNFGFFFDDIKIQNLVLHDNKIKMIDFSCPINTNNSYDKLVKQFVNSKLSYIYYFPYPIITNIILYQQINMIKLIGTTGSKINYFSLLNFQSIEYENNLIYILKLIKKILDIYNNYFSTYKKEIKLLNYNHILKIKTKEDIEKYSEYKNISIKDFCFSIMELLFDSPKQNKYEYKNNQDLINDIFINYNKLINQLFSNEKEKIDKIIFLLKNINLYSFGFIFIEWIYYNITSYNDIISNNDSIEKIFDIIILSCTNYFIIDDDLFFSIPSLNTEKLNFFFANNI